jgi:hypothetical protein
VRGAMNGIEVGADREEITKLVAGAYRKLASKRLVVLLDD